MQTLSAPGRRWISFIGSNNWRRKTLHPKLKSMATPFDSLASRRAIIDRRTIADSLIAITSEHEGNATKVRQAIVTRLKQALTEGRIEIGRRLLDHPSRGREAAAAQASQIGRASRRRKG